MKAATYIRVSSEEQAETGTSLDTQRERTRAYVEAQEWEFVAEFEDAGVSGAKASRPALDRLMQACRDGEVEVVVVTKHDRLARSLLNALLLIRDLDEIGAEVQFTDEPNDTGLMRNLRFAIAEDERERIRERTQSGRQRVKAQGYYAGGPFPFGFHTVQVEGTKHRRLVVNEEQAETIRVAARLLLDERRTCNETAEHLNALDRKPQQAKAWNATLVRHVLSHERVVPEILDQERYDLVQARLAETSVRRRPRDQVYPLSLRIIGTCGAPHHGLFRRDIDNRFYVCNNKLDKNKHQKCDDPSIRADEIEYVVWEQVCDLLSRPERLVALAEEYLGLRGKQIEVERDEYAETQKKLDGIDSGIQNLLLTSAKAGLSSEDISTAVQELTRERDALRRHLAMIESWRADSQKASERMRRLWALAEEAHRRLPTMTRREQKEVLALLDVRVTVLENQVKAPGGHRIVSPARIRIEGRVNDQILLSADRTARDIETTTTSYRSRDVTPPIVPFRIETLVA